MKSKEQDQQEELNNGRKAMSSYAKYSGAAFQMIVIIGAFSYAGYKIDEKRQAKTPLVTAILSLCGVIVSLYLVIRSIKS